MDGNDAFCHETTDAMFVRCTQDVIIGASRIKRKAGSIQRHDSVSMGDDDALRTKRRARLLGAKKQEACISRESSPGHIDGNDVFCK